MACKCISELRTRMEAGLAKHMEDKTRFGAVKDSGQVEFQNPTVFIFSSGDFSPLAVKVTSSFYALKKDGQPMKSRTKLENLLRIQFCPICGTEHTGPTK